VVVGVPAFDEERTIAKVVLQAQRYADKVVVCDDGSKDLTAEIAERLGADVVRHERNLGYGAALRSLFRRARELGADVLVTLDGDGQHDPSEVPVVVAPVVDGKADVVIGSRFISKDGAVEMPSYRRFGAKVITSLVNSAAVKGITDAQSGFRSYSRRAFSSLAVTDNGMGASVEVLLKSRENGLHVLEVPVSCKYAGVGVTSTEHPVRHGLGVVFSVFRFVVEKRPLLSLGVPGLLCLLGGLGFGVWTLQIFAVKHYVETNLALISLGFLLFGVFLSMSAITLYAISRIAEKLNFLH